MDSLNILHVFRAPVGGLFRHVLDLTREQIARGHRVGIVADSLTGGASAEKFCASSSPSLALGLTPLPDAPPRRSRRSLALAHVMRRVVQSRSRRRARPWRQRRRLCPPCLSTPRAVRAYTPHGGSLLFGHDSLTGKFYLATERLLMLRGDLFLFESAYSETIFRRKIGNPRGLVRIVHNGVSPAEFAPIPRAPDASDLVFMGELRPVKGVDMLIEAIAIAAPRRPPRTQRWSATAPNATRCKRRSSGWDLRRDICFKPAMPAREALSLGRIMVVPSRAESLPYVVLEAAAAGKPLITTNVGGIPEIYGPLSDPWYRRKMRRR